MLKFRCPLCEAGLKAPPSKAGKVSTCPRCKQRIQVPIAVDAGERRTQGGEVTLIGTALPVRQEEPSLEDRIESQQKPDATSADDPFAPYPMRVASLIPGEKHLYSFIIEPYLYLPGRLFPPRFEGWEPEYTRFLFHLTDGRIILEPYPLSDSEFFLSSGMLQLTGAMGNVWQKIALMSVKKDFEAGQRKIAALADQVLTIPLRMVAQIEPVKISLIRCLARIDFAGGQHETIHCVVRRARVKLLGLHFSLPHTREFISIVSQVVANAR